MMQASAILREFGAVTKTVVPTISPEQSEAMVEDAYERGVAEGLAQAQAEIAASTAAALEDLTARLADMTAERQSAAETATAEATDALATVVRALCPRLSALGLAERARDLLDGELRSAPRPIVVRASPEVAGALDSLGEGVTVESDEDMPDTRLDLTWPEGGAAVDAGAVAEEIMGLADALSPRPDPDPVEENPHE